MAIEDTPDQLSRYFIMPRIDISGFRYPISIYKDGTFEIGCFKNQISWFETVQRTDEALQTLSETTLDWYFANKDFLLNFAKEAHSQMVEFDGYADDQSSDYEIIGTSDAFAKYFSVRARPKVDI